MAENKKWSLLTAADIHRHKGESRLMEVLKTVSGDPDAVLPDVVLMGGDYAGGGRPPRMGGKLEEWQPVYSTEKLKEEIRGVFGKDTSVFLTYGSHDQNAIEGNDGFFSGPADMGDYYIYGISFCQMRYASAEQMSETGYEGADRNDPFGSCADEAARNFLSWLADADVEKPLFVMSHMPLHAQRHDNLGAQIWFDALNRAAESRPVYFFFAHNHHSEERPDAGPDFHFVSPGGILPVQQKDREGSADNLLKFTYLNAGYIIKGCAVLITMERNDLPGGKIGISVRKYSADR